MIALVLALALASPAPIERLCAETCSDLGAYHRCYVTPRRACLKREWVCVDGPRVDCVPLAVDLGAWSPEYQERPSSYYQPGEDWPAVTPPPPSQP